MNSHQAPRGLSTFTTFHLGESPPDGPRGLGCHPVDPPVEEDHDHHGGKERSNGAVEDIAGVCGQDALWGALGGQHEPTPDLGLRLRAEEEGGEAGAGGLPGDSVVHSHWSRNVEARLSLVERFRVLLAPVILCHKEPARRI